MNATESVLKMYNIEELKEIADHGCQSGVCSQHIYYADTIEFFDKYEDDIMDEFVLNFGTEFLVDLFRDADASLPHYKNAVCWAFIELVASEAVADQQHEYAMSYA